MRRQKLRIAELEWPDVKNAMDKLVEGDKALRLAVVVRAMLDATGNCTNIHERNNARQWLFDDDFDSKLPFPDICSDLSLEPSIIRNLVTQCIDNDIRIARAKERNIVRYLKLKIIEGQCID